MECDQVVQPVDSLPTTSQWGHCEHNCIINLHEVLKCVAFNTGTVKPAVLPKRVRSRFLAHRDTLRTRAAVSWVPMGSL